MRRDSFIVAFTGALSLLFLLAVATRQLLLFPLGAVLYLAAFAAQAAAVYAADEWLTISLKWLYPGAVLAAGILQLLAVAWLSGNSLAYLFSFFWGRHGLGMLFAPYVVANGAAYALFIARKRVP